MVQARRPLSYPESTIRRDLNEGVTDIFDDFLNQEFGPLALQLSNEGLNDYNDDIPYFNHQDLVNLLKSSALSTTPSTLKAKSPSITTITSAVSVSATTLRIYQKAVISSRPSPLTTFPPPSSTISTILSYTTDTTPIDFTTIDPKNTVSSDFFETIDFKNFDISFERNEAPTRAPTGPASAIILTKSLTPVQRSRQMHP